MHDTDRNFDGLQSIDGPGPGRPAWIAEPVASMRRPLSIGGMAVPDTSADAGKSEQDFREAARPLTDLHIQVIRIGVRESRLELDGAWWPVVRRHLAARWGIRIGWRARQPLANSTLEALRQFTCMVREGDPGAQELAPCLNAAGLAVSRIVALMVTMEHITPARAAEFGPFASPALPPEVAKDTAIFGYPAGCPGSDSGPGDLAGRGGGLMLEPPKIGPRAGPLSVHSSEFPQNSRNLAPSHLLAGSA